MSMTKEQVQEMLDERLEDKLKGNKSSVQQEVKESPVVKKLDGDDTVRLENLLLKQQVEGLVKSLEDKRRQDIEKVLVQVRKDYQAWLADKYEVDLAVHNITVDAKAYTLTITPIE